MVDIQRQAEFDTTSEWLEAVASETGTDVEVLQAVATQLRPDLMSLPNSEKRDQLQRLLKAHTDFMTEVEGDADAWIDFYFERDGEVDNFYQYSMMSHNLTRVTKEEVERIQEVAEEEDMDLDAQPEHNFAMATQMDWDGVEEELSLVAKVLREVYDVEIVDLERVEEIRGGDTISWTEV
jgi:hypothetical protein